MLVLLHFLKFISLPLGRLCFRVCGLFRDYKFAECYVFDGEKKLAYNETDELNPQGVYGRCTLAGEEVVRAHPHHIIIRSGGLFGLHKRGLIKS